MIYKIVTDSSSDVTEIADIPFCSVPLKIHTSEREFSDTPDFDTCEMIDYLERYRGRSGSSCPNTQEYLAAFEGADEIFCVTITKNLSGSYSSAVTAAQEYSSQSKGKNVHVFDTLTVGPENQLLIEKLCELIADGHDFETIVKDAEQYAKSTRLAFSLQSLKNLANNGRVNPIIAKMATALGIRAIGRASDEGTLELSNKARGQVRSLECVFDNMQKLGYTGGRVRIHHCQGEDEAHLLKEKILSRFPCADIKISPTRALCSFYAEKGGLLIGYEA